MFPRLRITLSVLLLLVVLLLGWNAGSAGLARLLAGYAAASDQVDPANAAVRLSPSDAEVHYLRGLVLDSHGDLPAAIVAWEMAASLRPGDYLLWLTLARARELNGDVGGAIDAATEAVKLAPYYAQPHWQLGNILVRAGRRDQGFSELRLAAASDPALLASTIDLAWQLSDGKVNYVTQALQPHNPETYKALAEYFRKRGQVAEAVRMFKDAGSGTEPERLAYVGELISLRKFQEAHTLWSMAHPSDPDGLLMFDPGFEQETNLDEPGFGWRAAKPTAALTLSLDNSNPHQGRSSLRVDFNGESDPTTPVISQLVLLEAKTSYQLSVAFRTENLVSGGLPTVLVRDPNDNKVLGQTGALPQTTDGWDARTTIDFTTGESPAAIQVALQRVPCARPQCPIFGRLWLDNFSLKKSQ